ncbi:hypothetical protein MWN52_13165 [Pseudoxanthomonas winnipegensis]|uniref:hypothetical protein n=1 Tax=Pseudoxanthomonas winnipegensis TaxID=2480810 RepID=UPI0025751BE9|nr:hypothetical protein [Pseudoxanthomonas winnipegensis]WJI14578.1 hypothetical protein MWN52_13165 [Pseudoxanthomonas winnipegensis]
MDQDLVAIVLPWFHQSDYDGFRGLVRDRQWHRTYQAWTRAAPDARARLERQGMRVVQMPVRLHDFKGYCERNGRRPNSEALVDYCNALARHSPDAQVPASGG